MKVHVWWSKCSVVRSAELPHTIQLARCSSSSSCTSAGTVLLQRCSKRFSGWCCAGTGNRIDGKASGSGTSTPATASARTTMDSTAAASSGPSTGGGLKAGKVVFGDTGANGGGAGAPPTAPGIPGNRLAARLANKKSGEGKPSAAQPPKKQEQKEEEPTFVAFDGKGRSLKD